MDEMTRGGRRKERDGPERRCIATGESGPVDRLIRFVLSPEGEVVPDLAGRLPGRGVWLTADRALAERAVKKRLFARAFRAPVKVADDLPDRLDRLLAERMVATIGLARKAGAAVRGAEKVRARILSGEATVLIQARDGAPGGRKKLASLARAAGGGRIECVELLDAEELGLAFGREFAIHAALDAGGFATRLMAEARRLSGFRKAPPGDATAKGEAGRGAADDGPDAGKAGQGPENEHLNDIEGRSGPGVRDDL
jgi:predicted RNA-binding protein YlxR (DUF448 family)